MFTFEEFRDAVKEGIKKVMNQDEVIIEDTEDFGDYGLDSLTSMGLVIEIESSLGIDLGEFNLDDANTITLFYNAAVKIVEESE
jgi:acyl carrier protein